ncbi:MAG: uroporphyrinogen decarboxylase family protein [Bacillota bacterium]
MNKFSPNYENIVQAAKNCIPDRLPLYEHIISTEVMEEITNSKFADLIEGDAAEKNEFFRNYCSFFREMGYDTVSFEACITFILPNGGALGGHVPGVIKTRGDFEKYPWKDLSNIFFQRYSETFAALRDQMPVGMRAIGGAGNGIFECVQDLVGYEELSYISIDDPELYADLFKAVGSVALEIWSQLLKEYGDVFCVCRFGDDLGFNTSTLLPPKDISQHVIPQYAKIVERVHSYKKPFLLHSCGKIFDVMDEIIKVAKIDAKHSNEDSISLFPNWVEKYGDRIGLFGGIDMDHLCMRSEKEIKEIVLKVINDCEGKCGFALGSGNSIANYVPAAGYLAMVETVREYRGDYNK